MTNSTIQTLKGATNAPRLGGSFTVPDVAEKLGLIEEGKGEFHGANPTGQGATEDGFILYAEGNALDRKTGQKYTSPEVAQMAGIEPMEYEPYREFKLTNGDFSGSFPSGQKRGLEAVIGTPTAPITSPKSKEGKPPFDFQGATSYEYRDGGELLFEVLRNGNGAQKQLLQRKPDGRGGWVYSLGDVRRVLYRADEVRGAHYVLT